MYSSLCIRTNKYSLGGRESKISLSHYLLDSKTSTTHFDSPAGWGEVRPDGASVSYSYDNNGNMTVLVNPNLVAHSFSYTANDQRKSYTTPISGGYSYLYDKDRRLSSVTYPSGQGIGNFYLDGNLDSTVTPEGTISYGYDCGGKLGSVTKGTESTSYTYDGSLLLSDTRLGTVNEVIDYTYDTDMRVGSIGYAGGVESFLYDNDGLLTGAGPFTITRNVSNGLPEAVSDGTAAQSRVFSGYGEVDGVDYTVGVAAPYSWSVTRDLAGRITQKVENIGLDTVTWDYTYDLMGRLETVYKDSLLAEAYSYDNNGNRTSENNVLRGVSRFYTHSVEDHIITAGADSYTFDVDGFLTSRTVGANTDTFNYSSRGELLSVTLSTGTRITYDHDPLGRRVAKRVNGTITEKYLWQDSTTLLAVYDGTDALIQRFSYADGRMPVSMSYNASTYYLTYDQVGSLRAITDSTGAIVKRVDYDSYGNILSDSNPTFSIPFGFAGGLQDRDTGLVRFGARDYDPAIGKWTDKDPIDFKGGDLNLFGYVLGDPVNGMDPEGRVLHIIGGFFGGGITGAIAGGITNAIIAYGVSGGDLEITARKFISGAKKGFIVGGITGAVLASGLSTVALSVSNPLWLGFEKTFEWAAPKVAAIFFNVLTWEYKNPKDAFGENEKIPCR